MKASTTEIDWNRELVDQLDWHWNQIGVLVLHISPEVIHHGSELCLMRDLYRTTAAGSKAVGETAGVRS
jgi:hypothetical protein